MFRQPKTTSGSSGGMTTQGRKIGGRGGGSSGSSSGGSGGAAGAQQSSGSAGAAEKCHYPHRVCTHTPLPNYDYCIKHILEDKNAPYKPCGYTYAVNNKRCLQPAPRGDKKDIGYCAMHLWKTQLKRQKSMAKYVPPVTPEALLSTLSHYVRPMRSSTGKNPLNQNAAGLATSVSPSSASLELGLDHVSSNNTTRAINPFVEADVSKATVCRTHVLECASESDSDVEPSNLDSVWPALQEDSSDAESIDSQLDDPLRHAGVFTAEEVITMTRNKSLRLQKLYRRQFERLGHILREKRRTYLFALKKEKETLSTIYDQSRTSAKEQRLYDKLKALNRYHKRSTTENVAHYASLEKRAREIGGVNYRPSGHNTKCSFTEGGVRCSRVSLPLTKFCFKHILDDPNQSMFRACGCEKADSTTCQEAIISSLCSSDTCILHVRLPLLPHLNLPVDSSSGKEGNGNRSLGCSIDNESELDASATESAFSTDNRESPDGQETITTSPATHKGLIHHQQPLHETDNNPQPLILSIKQEDDIHTSEPDGINREILHIKQEVQPMDETI